MLRVSDCVGDSISIAILQPTEWQHLGNQIDVAFIFAWAHFVSVNRSLHRRWIIQSQTACCGRSGSSFFGKLCID